MDLTNINYTDLKQLKSDLELHRDSLERQAESLYGICDFSIESVERFKQNEIHDKIKRVDAEIKQRQNV